MILTIYIPQMSSFRVIAIFTVSEFFKTPPRSSSTDIRNSMCCSVLQCAAVCCSVLQCVVVNYSVLHRLVWHGSCKRHRRLNVLQCAAMCRSVLSVLQCSTVCYSVLQCVAIYEKALIPFSQCFSVFRSKDTRQQKATFSAVIFAQMAVNKWLSSLSHKWLSSLSSAKIFMAGAMYDAILSYLAAARPAIWNIQKVFLGRRNGPQLQSEYEYRSSYASWIHSTGKLNVGRISVKPISRSRIFNSFHVFQLRAKCRKSWSGYRRHPSGYFD